jgi:mono/diheme cytochrome c family protein
VDARLTLVAIVACTAFAGCTQEQNASTSSSSAPTAPMVTTASANPIAAAIANGKAIFATGKDIDGVAISAKTKPLKPSCAACHGVDGSGGKKIAGATSADLRHKSLASGKHPYTQALLERAIATGIDNEGKPLDPVMPRWVLSKRDLHDVAYYVLTQLK